MYAYTNYYRGCSTFNGLTTCTEWKYNGSTLIAEKCNQDPGATASPPPPVNYQQFESNNDGYIAVTLPVRGNINPNDPNGNRDIHNKTTDPCISKTVEVALKANKDVIGVMADIIKKLDRDITINVNVYDAEYNSNGKAGKTSNTEFKFDPATNKLIGFSTDITLSRYHIKDASKEYAAIALLHEVLHAYFRNSTATTEEFDGKDHSTIANNYIKPMAEFLNKVFDTPIEDAYALA